MLRSLRDGNHQDFGRQFLRLRRSRKITTRYHFLFFIHVKDRKMDFTSNAPSARFGFIQNVKTWPRRTSQMIPKSPRIALHAKPNRLAKGRKIEK